MAVQELCSPKVSGSKLEVMQMRSRSAPVRAVLPAVSRLRHIRIQMLLRRRAQRRPVES
jgi:hypothetical protein